MPSVNPKARALPGTRASRPHKGWHDRGYLPHFDAGALVQSITFRLADSLPRSVYAQVVATAANDPERRRRLDSMIDEGRGSCRLRAPENARIVKDALHHFDGERYRLIAWVIMPNHVHVLIEQIDGFPLADIVHSWKSFAAKEINKRRDAGGQVWASDYFDRFIRDESHLAGAIRYIEENPVKAGLATRPEDWPFSSASRDRGHLARKKASADGTSAVPGADGERG
jgi:REP element-mobilizing transposase RayT